MTDVPEKEIASGNMTLAEVCSALAISEATGKNWVRLKKLIPNEDGVTFDRASINRLVEEIENGDKNLLKSRRNKKKKKGNAVYKGYIDNYYNVAELDGIVNSLTGIIDDNSLRIILANFAIQLILQKDGEPLDAGRVIDSYIKGSIDLGVYTSLINDICGKISTIPEHLDLILDKKIKYIPFEDTLGLIYLSLRDFGERKSAGAYFTPIKVVKRMIDIMNAKDLLGGESILDPCCGTGNFLLNLCQYISTPEKLFGYDIDEISVLIARINVALATNSNSIDFLYENLICCDALKFEPKEKFDIIIGNPPWGFEYGLSEMSFLRNYYNTASMKAIESYDLFVEKSICLLKDGGILAFVLPEAILNVGSHKEVRKIILEECSFNFIAYLDEAFYGVQCPSVLLCLEKTKKPGEIKGCDVFSTNKHFTISKNRVITDCEFSLNISDEQYDCICKIEELSNKTYLKAQAVFAMGIVTGNNKEHISNICDKGFETILKGANIYKYGISDCDNYINFSPDKYQQVAGIDIYRVAEKLVYKFISDTLVFAYDNKGLLSLNSCNILIPKIPNMDIKYVLAILNSRVANFYYKMRFKSTKILRSHLEQIPIPIVDVDIQKRIITLVDMILNCDKNYMDYYEELDKIIMNLYGFDKDEKTIICDAQKDKYFLPIE